MYVVRPEDGEAEKVIHGNLLTQCMFLPVERASQVRREEVGSDVEEECEVEPEQISGGEEENTLCSVSPEPNAQRRNPPRNRRLPKKLCLETQVVRSDEELQKIKRGWELWQRAKARRPARHV